MWYVNGNKFAQETGERKFGGKYAVCRMYVLEVGDLKDWGQDVFINAYGVERGSHNWWDRVEDVDVTITIAKIKNECDRKAAERDARVAAAEARFSAALAAVRAATWTDVDSDLCITSARVVSPTGEVRVVAKLENVEGWDLRTGKAIVEVEARATYYVVGSKSLDNGGSVHGRGVDWQSAVAAAITPWCGY